MRTTVTLDEELVNELKEAFGITETSVLVREALVRMRQRLAAERLIRLGGTDPDAWAPNEGDEPPQ